MVRYIDDRCKLEPGLDSSAHTEIPISTPQALINREILISADSTFSMTRLSENPQVLALEFKNKWTMRPSLARIATYVETLGKARIPTLEESPHGVGYDLKLSDVADFYNACTTDHVNLLPEEKVLRDQLIAQGLITPMEKGLWAYTQPIYQPSSNQVLIAIDPSLGSYDRKVTFIHEYSHALYFLDDDFRFQVSEAFSLLDPETQRFLYGAMIASGYYESGEKWLIETETQAHAVEPQGGNHGFLNLMLAAEENCGPLDQPSLVCLDQSSFACEDFWSYTGDLRGLMTYLNDHYTAISLGRIPLLASKEEEKNSQKQNKERLESFLKSPEIQKLLKERMKNSMVQDEIEKSRRVWSSPSSTVERAEAELNRLQKRFDKSHEGGRSEETGELVCIAESLEL